MTRYVGFIGIKQEIIETSPGIYTESIIEKRVTGEIKRKSLRWLSGELAQDKPSAGHYLSIIASEPTVNELLNVVYVTWKGKRWTVKSIEHERPRLNLTLGGIYNGE